MFFTKEGIIKRTPISEYESIRQNGKIAITLREGDTLIAVKEVQEIIRTPDKAVRSDKQYYTLEVNEETKEHVVTPVKNPKDEEIANYFEDMKVGIAASNGKMVNFPVNEVRPMGRSASGVKGIELVPGEIAVGVTAQFEGSKVLVITDKGYGKMTNFIDEDGDLSYRITKRGAKGVSTLKSNDKVGKLVDVRAVNGDEDLMVITTAGIVIRTHLNQVRTTGRNTQGVKIMNLEGRQRVASVAIVPFEEDAPEGEEEVLAEEENSAIENPEE